MTKTSAKSDYESALIIYEGAMKASEQGQMNKALEMVMALKEITKRNRAKFKEKNKPHHLRFDSIFVAKAALYGDLDTMAKICTVIMNNAGENRQLVNQGLETSTMHIRKDQLQKLIDEGKPLKMAQTLVNCVRWKDDHAAHILCIKLRGIAKKISETQAQKSSNDQYPGTASGIADAVNDGNRAMVYKLTEQLYQKSLKKTGPALPTAEEQAEHTQTQQGIAGIQQKLDKKRTIAPQCKNLDGHMKLPTPEEDRKNRLH